MKATKICFTKAHAMRHDSLVKVDCTFCPEGKKKLDT